MQRIVRANIIDSTFAEIQYKGSFAMSFIYLASWPSGFDSTVLFSCYELALLVSVSDPDTIVNFIILWYSNRETLGLRY